MAQSYYLSNVQCHSPTGRFLLYRAAPTSAVPIDRYIYGSSTEHDYVETCEGDPNVLAWGTSTTWYVYIDISTGINKDYLEVKIVRIGNDGTVRDTYTSSEGEQEVENAGLYTFTFSTSFTDRYQKDRIQLDLIWRNENHADTTVYWDTKDSYLNAASLTPSVASKCRGIINGAESGDTDSADRIWGSPTVSSSVKFNGDYSYEISPGASAAEGLALEPFRPTGSSGAAGKHPWLYAEARVRFGSLPSSGNNEFLGLYEDSWSLNGLHVRITSGGYLELYDGTTQVGSTGSTPLSTGIWYRIGLFAEQGTSGDYDLRLNGTTELSGTATLTSVDEIGCITIGNPTYQGSAGYGMYVDDVRVDLQEWPGDTVVTRMDVDGNGTDTGWLASTGNKNECIDDVPANDDTDYIYSSSASDQYTGTLESCSSASISGTVYAVVFCAQARAIATSNIFLRFRADSAAQNAMSQILLGASYYHYEIIRHLTAPGTSPNTWTTTLLDSAEAGVQNYSASASRVTSINVMVEHDAPAGGLPAAANAASCTSTAKAPSATGSGTAPATATEASCTATAGAPTATGSGSVPATAGLASSTSTALAPSAAPSGSAPASAGIASCTATAGTPSAVATGSAPAAAQAASSTATAIAPSATGSGTAPATAQAASSVATAGTPDAEITLKADAAAASSSATALAPSATGSGTAPAAAQAASSTATAIAPSATGSGSVPATAQGADSTSTAGAPSATGSGSVPATAVAASSTATALAPDAETTALPASAAAASSTSTAGTPSARKVGTIEQVCGFEGGTDTSNPTDFYVVGGTGGTVTIQSTTKYSGNWACEFDCDTTETGYAGFRDTTSAGIWTDWNLSEMWTRFMFRYSTAPGTSSSEEICGVFNNFQSTPKAYLRFATDSGGDVNLALYDKTGTSLIGTGSTDLAADTWYEIGLRVGAESSEVSNDGDYEITIDGVSELSGQGNTGIENVACIYFGKMNNRDSNAVKFYIDDIAFAQSYYAAPGRVGRMDIDGNGYYTNWTASSGNKNECIDDIVPGSQNTHDGDGTYIYESANNYYYSATLESASSAGISNEDLIHGVSLLTVSRTTTTGALQQGLRESSTDALAGANSDTTSYRERNWWQATAPDGNRWTPSKLDGTEAVFRCAAAADIRVTYACLMVYFETTTQFADAAAASSTTTAGTPTATGSGTAPATADGASSTSTAGAPSATGSGSVPATADVASSAATALDPSAAPSGSAPATAAAATCASTAGEPTAVNLGALPAAAEAAGSSATAGSPTAAPSGSAPATAAAASSTATGGQPSAVNLGINLRSVNCDFLVCELLDPDNEPTWHDRAAMCGCYAGITPQATPPAASNIIPEEMAFARWGL